MTTSSDVIIIGGGISGTATAWELASNGIRTTLLEAGNLASMASGWTLAGVRQSGRHVAELPLAEAAVKRWAGLTDELDADVEYRQDGNLRLALTENDIPTIRDVVNDGQHAGIEMHFLESNEAIRDIAPALATDIPAASWCPTDGHANPGKTVLAFAEAARRAGADIRTNTPVRGIRFEQQRVTGVEIDGEVLACDTVIVAAGIYAPRLLAPLGLDIPLRVTLVPAIQTVPIDEPNLKPVLGQAQGGVALRQQVSGQFRITGAAEPWNEGAHTYDNVQPKLRQMATLVAAADRVVPGLAESRIATTWGGLIDLTPDALPVIEKSPEFDNLVIATGFSGHGFCLGPVTGEILAELAVEGTTRHPIEPFKRARLAEQQTSESLTLHG